VWPTTHFDRQVMGKRKADFEGRGTKKRRKNKNEGPAKISTSKMKKKVSEWLA